MFGQWLGKGWAKVWVRVGHNLDEGCTMVGYRVLVRGLVMVGQ